MRPDEVRALGAEELSERITELEEELFRLRIQNTAGQLENPLRIRMARRDLARAKTIQGEGMREAVEA